MEASELNKAAEEYCNKQPWPNDGLDEMDKKECKDDFKAGAEWQWKRMLEDAVECDVYGHCSGWLTFGYVPECDFDFKPGDKVKLITIKKEK